MPTTGSENSDEDCGHSQKQTSEGEASHAKQHQFFILVHMDLLSKVACSVRNCICLLKGGSPAQNRIIRVNSSKRSSNVTLGNNVALGCQQTDHFPTVTGANLRQSAIHKVCVSALAVSHIMHTC